MTHCSIAVHTNVRLDFASWTNLISPPQLASTIFLTGFYNNLIASQLIIWSIAWASHCSNSQHNGKQITCFIVPVSKVQQPQTCADYFMPISIKPILARVMEKEIANAKVFFYLLLTHHERRHLFKDQFAFRRTGSTTAALTFSTPPPSFCRLMNVFV